MRGIFPNTRFLSDLPGPASIPERKRAMEDELYEADAESPKKKKLIESRVKKPRTSTTAPNPGYAPAAQRRFDPMADCTTPEEYAKKVKELKEAFRLVQECDRPVKGIYWVSQDPNDKEAFWFR